MKEIQLTRGCVALVDDEDFETLSCHRWYTSINGYAVREAVSRKAMRVAALADRFGVHEGKIQELIDDSESGLQIGERGWIRLAPTKRD